MILRFSLIEMQLGELLYLEKLAKRDQQIELPELSVVQKNLAASSERIRVCRFAFCLQTAFELALQNSTGSACFGNNLICLDAAEFHFNPERGFFGFGLHGKSARNIPAPDVR